MVSLTTQAEIALLAGAISPNTLRAYRGDLRDFLGWLQDRKITTETILAYRNELLENHAPSTVARMLSTVRSFCDVLVEYGKLYDNPARGKRVKLPKLLQESTTVGLSLEQAETLLKQPDRTTLIGQRDYAILSLMLRTGLRRSEVIGIKVGDFQHKSGHFVCTIIGKGNRRRDVKLSDGLWHVLRDYIQATERPLTMEAWFFTAFRESLGGKLIPTERPLSANGLVFVIEKYAKSGGIVGISPHSLRHTFITLALAGGAPLHRVQYAVGHSDPRTTERYDRNRLNLDDNATDYIPLKG